MNRRPFAIYLSRLRVWADQRVEIPRLEFVRVLGERLDVAHPVVAGAGAKHLGVKRQRGQRRVPAGAPAADDEPVGIGSSLLDEVSCGVDVVVDIDDSPVPVEALAILAAVPGAATAVDTHHTHS